MTPVALSAELLGPRVRLAKYEPGFAPAMFAAVDADRARLRTYLPWVDLIRQVSDEENYIRSATLQWMELRTFDFGLFLREGGSYLGNIGVHSIAWNDDRAEIGYWLTGSAEGKGYIGEALAALEA